jgi:hypothetical protein
MCDHPAHTGEGSKLRHVFVSKIGNKVLLEPLARTEPELAAVRAEIDAVRSGADLFFGILSSIWCYLGWRTDTSPENARWEN